jgi:hypothetical protein
VFARAGLAAPPEAAASRWGLSRAIVRNKAGYYRLLQAVRDEADAPQV